MLARILATLWLALFSFHAEGQVSCGEQPKDVPVEVQQVIKGDAEGKAQLFTKMLGDAQLKGAIEASKKELYEKHQNIDKSQIDRYMIWVSCQNIMLDKTLTAFQKNQLWIEVYRQLLAKQSDARPIPHIEAFRGKASADNYPSFTWPSNKQLLTFLDANVGSVVFIKSDFGADVAVKQNMDIVENCKVDVDRMTSGELDGLSLPLPETQDDPCRVSIKFTNLDGPFAASAAGTGTYFVSVVGFFEIARSNFNFREEYILRKYDAPIELRQSYN